MHLNFYQVDNHRSQHLKITIKRIFSSKIRKNCKKGIKGNDFFREVNSNYIMSTLDLSSASLLILPHMLFANGLTLEIFPSNCILDKQNDTFGASIAKNTVCSKLYKNNYEKSMMDKGLSGIYISNGSSLMSYEDYQILLDRTTMRLQSMVQKASNWVRMN